MKELYKTHRPKNFKDMVGQDAVVEALVTLVDNDDFPHSSLFSGPSGTGKTTAARIAGRAIGCHKDEIYEVNSADFKGIDSIREIRNRMNRSCLRGDRRMYILDEVHQYAAATQDAMLKILEDTPDHVYFALATTDPHKLKKPLRTRCTEFKMEPIENSSIRDLVKRIAKKEHKVQSKSVVSAIVDAADGSARQALVLLHMVLKVKSEKKKLRVLEVADTENHGKSLAQLLLDTRTSWKQIGAKLKEIEKEDAEGIRRGCVGYARAVLLKADHRRAFFIIEFLSNPFYDAPTSHAMLAKSCWQITHTK